MKMRFSVLVMAACIGLAGAPAMADVKIKITGHPEGGYVASFMDYTDDSCMDRVILGPYATKQEARKAAEQRKAGLQGTDCSSLPVAKSPEAKAPKGGAEPGETNLLLPAVQ